MATQCIVHAQVDSVGVVVVEDVQAGAEITGWIEESDDAIAIRPGEPIPFGHKIALREIKAGETVVQYGHDIGQATADIASGAHVHTHNLTTKRW